MRKNIGFTLAEILIVIGVIGVVSALTLPALNNSRGDKETVTRVKKVYSNLNDAYGRARAAHGPLKTWLLNYNNENLGCDYDKDSKTCKNEEAYHKIYQDRTKIIRDRFAESLKVTQSCDYSNMSECYVESDTNAIGTKKAIGGWWDCTASSRKGASAIILEDGASIIFNNYTPNADKGGTIQRFLICADVDGPYRGPNAYGQDLFIYWIDNDEGVVPGGYDFNSSNKNYPCGADNDTCTAWVLQKGNMDYTKTSDGKTCSNGKVLQWNGTENSSCK